MIWRVFPNLISLPRVLEALIVCNNFTIYLKRNKGLSRFSRAVRSLPRLSPLNQQWTKLKLKTTTKSFCSIYLKTQRKSNNFYSRLTKVVRFLHLQSRPFWRFKINYHVINSSSKYSRASLLKLSSLSFPNQCQSIIRFCPNSNNSSKRLCL